MCFRLLRQRQGTPHCAVPRGTRQKCIIYYQGRKRVLVCVDVRADRELMRYLSAAAGLYAAPFGSRTLRVDVPFLVFVFVFCTALRVWRSLPPVPRFSSALWHYPQMPTGGAGVIFGYSLMGCLYQVLFCVRTHRGGVQPLSSSAPEPGAIPAPAGTAVILAHLFRLLCVNQSSA